MTGRKSDPQIAADAVTIRGIIDYLQRSPEPVPVRELAMTQYVSRETAKRLCRVMEKAEITELIPPKGWQLTNSFIHRDCWYSAEELAREVTA